jgi:hypothetical protein
MSKLNDLLSKDKKTLKRFLVENNSDELISIFREELLLKSEADRTEFESLIRSLHESVKRDIRNLTSLVLGLQKSVDKRMESGMASHRQEMTQGEARTRNLIEGIARNLDIKIDQKTGTFTLPRLETKEETGADIVAKINSLPPDLDKQIDVKHLKGMTDTRVFLEPSRAEKNLGGHGGGTGAGGSGGGFSNFEALSGTIDGSNTVFTISSTPSGITLIFRGGSLQKNNVDYTISGVTITFTSAPDIGEVLMAIF